MNNSPKRKRLKQSSLLDMFNTQRQQKELEEEVLNDMFSSNVGCDFKRQQRELLAEAAEHRRNFSSVTNTQRNSPGCNLSEGDDKKRKHADGNVSHYYDDVPSTSTTVSHDSDGNVSHYNDDVPSTTVSHPDTAQTLEYHSSQSLFSDSEPNSSQSQHIDESEPSSPQPSLTSEHSLTMPSSPLPSLTSKRSLGVPYDTLNKRPDCSAKLGQLLTSPDHTVLFRPHIQTECAPQPFPENYRDRWDNNFVRMPCSSENLYPFKNENGQKRVISRWEMIKSTLQKRIHNSLDLEEAILKYNARYCNKWDFRGLHSFFLEVLDEDESNQFFQTTMPGMIDIALQLPNICTQCPPLLKSQKTHSITMSQKQVASLLANAFFCTFPRRNAQQKKSEYSRFPDINFNKLFEGGQAGIHPTKAEKLKCIINYFRRVTLKEPSGTITFKRCAIDVFPEWNKSTTKLSNVHVSTYGTIEDQGRGMLQMDFANKFIGGGVLGYGCVQEEIRFLICPELIIARLFTEVLDDNECLKITGAERYSDYTGYGNTFKWKSDYHDNTPRDAWGRLSTEIVALDALVFRRYDAQFKPGVLRREVNKAYCGFSDCSVPVQNRPAIATGNWGCGAFGGDPRLKALVQLMAAAECQRDIAYFTFNDKKLCKDIHDMHLFLSREGATVGGIWHAIQLYQWNGHSKSSQLYNSIYQIYTNYNDSTDDESEDKTPVYSTPELLTPESRDNCDYKASTP